MEEKRDAISASRFNEQMIEVSLETRARLRAILDPHKYLEFVRAVSAMHARDYARFHLGWDQARTAKSNGRWTECWVYATQYDAETDDEVALPDKYLKFANRGWSHAPGYEGSTYVVGIVRVSPYYEVPSAIVWDVGPWNEDDNYTDTPVPRRMFTGLPDCLPEAQAAFEDGYNGGRDQFGRTVTNPAGIDLGPGVAADLHLGYFESCWVWVTYNFDYDPSSVCEVGRAESQLSFRNPSTSPVRFDLSVGLARHVKISVFDVSGRVIGTVLDEDLEQCSREVSWVPPAQGTYFVRMSDGTRRSTQRLIVVK